jgi:hypothetical protein
MCKSLIQFNEHSCNNSIQFHFDSETNMPTHWHKSCVTHSFRLYLVQVIFCMSEAAYRINSKKVFKILLWLINSTESCESTYFIWSTRDLCENIFGYITNAYIGIPPCRLVWMLEIMLVFHTEPIANITCTQVKRQTNS